MAKKPWPASQEVIALMEQVKAKNHPLLIDAKVAVAFIDAKPFTKNRFNFGKASKFSSLNQLWQAKDQKYVYQILLPADGWYQVLGGMQLEAWLDLHLSRFHPEMIPDMDAGEVEQDAPVDGDVPKGKVNKKAKPKKDKFGRVIYTNDVKLDEETGEPIWQVDNLDLHVFAKNATRYGLWCEDLQNFGDAVAQPDEQQVGLFGATGFIPNSECTFKPNPVNGTQDLEDGGDAEYSYYQKIKD
jgi:hypothetical protein